ncbi:DNA polymerase III subunit delta' [Roseibium aquae]|uniref:DNA polymerase III subunit delta n=1 Tax=Roseibium aquae TaxID=1323746 RepID=A0A916TH71_9HYPH|nr:DNA polymerase III subunit delta' [Roseibium aquae]GGB44711.1 DNA polymerase III subunit delta' [Roseibium aquae]
MARRSEPVDTPEVDALAGLALPREQEVLIGHEDPERKLLDAYRSQRLHHALLLGGPKGIGKATLAFRFARFMLAHPDRFGREVAAARDLSIPDDHRIARQVAGGGHPNLLHLRRPWDEKRKRFKSELPVDEVRRTVAFFGSTASAESWRVCIVDAADDMNSSSANALLKILEEPPERCLFLVLSHTPGRILPTIRSRCRRLDLAPLPEPDLAHGLETLAGDWISDPADLSDATRFAEGSLRSALLLLSGDGLTIARGLGPLIEAPSRPDPAALHGLADLVAARGQTDNWESFQHVTRRFLHDWLRATARHAPHDKRTMNAISHLWDRFQKTVADTDALNLDRKQVVLDLVLGAGALRRSEFA